MLQLCLGGGLVDFCGITVDAVVLMIGGAETLLVSLLVMIGRKQMSASNAMVHRGLTVVADTIR